MNLKKLVLVGILSSSILGSSVALADEANREGNIPSKDTSELTEKEAAKAKSEGEIRFKLEDIDPDNPNNSGPLSINRISHIDFGEQVISGDDKVYHALYRAQDVSYDKEGVVEAGKHLPSYIQIKDNRATNAGWGLFVKSNGFHEVDGKTNSAGTSELTGAILSLTATKSVAKSVGNIVPTGLNKKVELGLDENYHPLVNAAKGEGMGLTDNLLGDELSAAPAGEKNTAITLSVPGTTAKVKDGKYTTELTWLLMSEPSADETGR
ncbi:WxL domain-containing protein [Carnobacterium divergens]|uniref:WxL domain-containing protein n=1 Tax=Carnobacterium divergens DSM 20623 TaxID=1449336 RepID=A0A0R2HXP1_CARDV|nr:WxL domain-containing protein [Carnobacterium divergens]KRN57554.1 hypothetical protein IV74_GL000074 [Carnobacterium divergens DSM 20623]MDO0875758.1 WxL domain-containing protein [Carnobacterium divergens]SUX15102.1 Uncharacterised protein [Carnobacterium divergens]